MAKHFFKKQTSKMSNSIVVYDLETTGLNTLVCDPIEIAAVVIDNQTLQIKEGGEFGPVLIKPTEGCIIEDKALEKNKITREKLKDEGLDQKVVFDQFCSFCRKFQTGPTKWNALISSGFNTNRFDNQIMNRLCIKYKYLDGDEPKLFHPIHTLDLIEWCKFFFHSVDGPQGYSLKAMAEFFGVVNEQEHEAMSDVITTYKILQRILGFQRKMNIRYLDNFRGAFNVCN